MTYITSVERIGYKRGQIEQAQSLVLRQLISLLGEVSEKNRTTIKSLSLEKINALGEALLYFTSCEDLSRWLEQNKNN